MWGITTGRMFHLSMRNKIKPKTTEEWFIGSSSSELSDASRKALIDWLEADPAHLAEYRKHKEIWDRSARVLAQNPEEFEASWQRFLNKIHQESKPVRTRRFFVLRIAASLALIAGLTATLVWLVPGNRPEQALVTQYEPENSYIITPDGGKVIIADDQTEIRYDSLAAKRLDWKSKDNPVQSDPRMMELVVPRSRRITIVLADGSRVWLNSESRMQYPEYFSGTTRTVNLEGEAFFDVQKAEGKSFVVTTRKMSIEVLGTTFNVTAYADADQISATLVEGSVEVKENGSTAVQVLKPSQRAVYSCENKTIDIHDTDTELYTSWIHGYLKFASESLDQVIRKLVRSYGISMKITDPSLKDYKFSGKLDLQETVNQVLNVIQLAAPLEYREENGTILILNKNE